MTQRYSSSSSPSAFFAISTRYAMLPAQPVKHLPRRLRAAGLYIRQSPLYAFDRLDAIKQGLVGLGILHDQLRLAIDRQHKGVPGLPQAVQQIDRVALEVAERADIIG